MKSYVKTLWSAGAMLALSLPVHAVDKTDAIRRGPGQVRTAVGDGGHDEYVVRFRGGETAQVAVAGDGDSDLDLFVYDENGDLVCSDEDKTDRMFCSWQPETSGYYTIRVKNFGMENLYVMRHN